MSAAEAIPDEGPGPVVYLPPLPGHRRACMRYRNGLMQEIDMAPEDLVRAIDEFLEGEAQTLVLREPRYGEPYVIRRRVVEEELLDVFTAWIAAPAPETGRHQSGVVVARDLPVNAEQEQARRRRRLS